MNGIRQREWLVLGLAGLMSVWSPWAMADRTVQSDPPQAAEQTPASSRWAMDVWSTALRGDSKELDRLFKSVPADAMAADNAARFRQSLELHAENIEKARAKRDEARAKALTELHEHVEKGDLPKALRSAVAVQTLSENLASALNDPDIIKVIDWAKDQIPKVEEKLDWLQAQELLYYLRTLYEDTGHPEQYTEYHKRLDWVNRRVSLLAQYAPKRLWELRMQRADRLGEKPLGEYKELSKADWRERYEGIKPEMLKQALKVAANEHIEDKGWKPLLVGGLQELKILATTASLDETFPKLQDPEMVTRWVGFVDEQLKMVNESGDKDLDSWTCAHILDALVKENDQTLKLDEQVIYREFGDGAMYELDQFSEIIWPDKLSRFKQATEGNFVGVGILIRHNDTQDIMVVNPLEGTPAYFGGVKPNDIIFEVDGEPTMGWSLNDAVDRITGAPATKVTLGLKREGAADLIPLTLERNVIKLRSVLGWWKKNLGADGTPEWDWYVDPVGRIAYIRISQFTEDTHEDLKAAWKEICAQGKPAGLVLDLRFDPGGLLTAAVRVSNMFLKQGVIVSGEDKEGRKDWADQRADPGQAIFADAGVPCVVLINQGSASASEIVSGSLQAHNAAIIVGERSFGKGSVQTVHQTAVNARLKLTTQYYRLPGTLGPDGAPVKGRLVHKRPGATDWGVDPDILVKMTPDQVTDSLELRQKADIIPQDETGSLKPDSPDRPDIRTLITEGMDPQLETALLILQARTINEHAANAEMRHASRE